MTNRRQFLKAGGGLAVSFGLSLPLTRPVRGEEFLSQSGVGNGHMPNGSKLQDATLVSAWLSIDSEAEVTLYAGKVELGTGVQTALAQLVAEELDVPIESVNVTMGDTLMAVDQGPTIGSLTMQVSTLPVRRAAATARTRILAEASKVMSVPVNRLMTRAARVHVGSDVGRSMAYKDLVPKEWATVTVDQAVVLKQSSEFAVIGKPVPRIDLPEKISGAHVYLQNVRLPGMVHARVIHPPLNGAQLLSVDRTSVAGMPGLVDVVVKENFVAVVCEQEFQAITASRTLAVQWAQPQNTIDSAGVYDAMKKEQGFDAELRNSGDVDASFARSSKRLTATYRTPYQTHGSIGPSCGVAHVTGEFATVWSATQGSFPLRDAVAALIGMPKSRVRVIWIEGAGCYGHNGADDASAEAALLSQMIGRPVRVQWMRNDEHGWDPKGPATEAEIRGSVSDDGMVESWSYTMSTPTHISRPMGSAGNLLPGRMMGLPPKPIRIGGDHCARTLYHFPNERVVVRWLPDGPLRPSAMRGLGAVGNSFANESFADELAHLAERDPVDFRIAHLSDERAIAVLQEVKAKSNWVARRGQATSANSKPNATVKEGVGVAFAELEPAGAYVAAVCCVEVDVLAGQIRVTKVFVAHDCGLIVNPDGLRNQIQGCVIQTLSRTLKEEFRFNQKEMLSLDWASYPILRFSELPSELNISLVNRPDKPPLGAGEPVALTIAPAVGNAVFHATGIRLRKTPFTTDAFKDAEKA
jgi:nicotinate dehydrogenase subunit B